MNANTRGGPPAPEVETMSDKATTWPGYRYFRGAFIVIGLAMAFLYFRDALTTDVVRPNAIKGSIWVLLALGTFLWGLCSRKRSRSTA